MKTITMNRIKIIALTLILALVSATALAEGGTQPQSGPAGQGVNVAVIKGRAPVCKDLLRANLPKDEVTRNPAFPKDEVEKYKARTLAQQQSLRSNPQFLAQEQLNRAIYGDHPAALVTPPPASIKRMSTEDLAKFHATYYHPNNAILAVVGDVTMKELLPKIQRAFGDWQKADIPVTNIPAVPAQSNARIYLIDRPGSVQTVLQL